MTAQFFVFFEIWRFLWFFQNFSENLNYFFSFKFWNSQPCSKILSEYSQGLRILPPNMTAQFFVVFEMWRFLRFFLDFQKTYFNFFFAKSEIPNPVAGSCQSNLKDCGSCLQILIILKIWNSQLYSSVLSGYSKELQILPHATAKRDCSNAFRFRDVTFFDFFKISQRTYLQRNSTNSNSTN